MALDDGHAEERPFLGGRERRDEGHTGAAAAQPAVLPQGRDAHKGFGRGKGNMLTCLPGLESKPSIS